MMLITAKQLLLLCAIRGAEVFAENVEPFEDSIAHVRKLQEQYKSGMNLNDIAELKKKINSEIGTSERKRRKFQFYAVAQSKFNLCEPDTDICWYAPHFSSDEFNYKNNFKIDEKDLSLKDRYLLQYFT